VLQLVEYMRNKWEEEESILDFHAPKSYITEKKEKRKNSSKMKRMAQIARQRPSPLIVHHQVSPNARKTLSTKA
jgi:hypothetical protein